MKEKKEQFTHLDASMRRVIEAGLNANEPFSLIARKISVATSTVSREVGRNRTYDSREQAAFEIFDYIECFYNRIRTHSALGWLSPAQFEEKMAKKNRPEEA